MVIPIMTDNPEVAWNLYMYPVLEPAANRCLLDTSTLASGTLKGQQI